MANFAVEASVLRNGPMSNLKSISPMRKFMWALFLALAMLFVAPVASLANANRVEAREATLPIEKEYVVEQNGTVVVVVVIIFDDGTIVIIF